jgi:hypothetical protein
LLNVPEYEYVALISSQKVIVATPAALFKYVSDFAPKSDVFLQVSRETQSHTVQLTLVAQFIGVVQSESFVHC